MNLLYNYHFYIFYYFQHYVELSLTNQNYYTDFDNKSENGQTVFINAIDDCYYIVVNNDAVTIY